MKTKKGGRPPKIEGKKCRITFAVSEKEYNIIEEYAEKRCLKKGQITRDIILKEIGNYIPPIPRKEIATLLKINSDFSSIKNNLNQITRALNVLVLKYANTKFLEHTELIATAERAKNLTLKMTATFNKILKE